MLEPGSYLWTSPHRYQYLRDHTGTLDVTHPARLTPPHTPPTSAGQQERHRRLEPSGRNHTTDSGSSFWPVGPIWISVSISGQTPQS